MKIEFPLFVFNQNTGDFYRYSENGQVLQFSYNYLHNHAGPYHNMDKADYCQFLYAQIFRPGMEIITPDYFETKLKDAIYYMVNFMAENSPMLTRKELHKRLESDTHLKNYKQ